MRFYFNPWFRPGWFSCDFSLFDLCTEVALPGGWCWRVVQVCHGGGVALGWHGEVAGHGRLNQ